MAERLYPELKRRQRAREHLLPSERDFIDRVERIVGYEIQLHLPAGSKFILGSDDAEAILHKTLSAATKAYTDLRNAGVKNVRVVPR